MLTTRVDQEIYIRKQHQDRLAIEKYYMTLEDTFAKSRRKIEVEQQFSEMQREELAKCRRRTAVVIR